MPLAFEGFDVAPAFTQVGGALTVTGGRLRPSAINLDCGGYSNTDMGSADHHVEGLLITTGTTANVYFGLLARWDGVDTNVGGDAYVFQQNFADLVLYSAVNSVFNTIATVTNAVASAGTYKLRLEVNGTTIGAKLNDAHISGSPFTNSALAVGTKAGLNVYSGGSVSDSEFEWWEAGTPAAPSSPINPLTHYRSSIFRR